MRRREPLLLRRVRLWQRLPALNHWDGKPSCPPVAKVGKRKRHVRFIGGMVSSELSATYHSSCCIEDVYVYRCHEIRLAEHISWSLGGCVKTILSGTMCNAIQEQPTFPDRFSMAIGLFTQPGRGYSCQQLSHPVCLNDETRAY